MYYGTLFYVLCDVSVVVYFFSVKVSERCYATKVEALNMMATDWDGRRGKIFF